MMRAEGSNGSVELVGDSIIIRRKGLANILTQGIQGEKTIPLSSITAVQFKDAGNWMAGMIQFSVFGGRDVRGGMMAATTDENAVLFEKKQQPAFNEMRDKVRALMGKPAAGNDDLVRLAELVEKGFLTREEFDARKAAILGG